MDDYDKIFTEEEIKTLDEFIELIDPKGEVFSQSKVKIKKLVLQLNENNTTSLVTKQTKDN